MSKDQGLRATIIGYRKGGQAIWSVLGGSGEGGDGGQGGGQAPPAGGQPADGGTQPPAGQKPEGGGTGNNLPDNWPKGPDGKPFDPDRALGTITKQREDFGKLKGEFDTFKKDQESQRAALAKALGLTKDEPLTAEQMQSALGERDGKIATLEQENKNLKLESRLGKVAAAKGAIPDLTWAQLSASGKLADIDLAAADLDKTLGALVDETLKAYPQLKATGFNPGDAGQRGSGTPVEGDVNSMIRSAARR